jgi:O-antigen/teichoic acid export membrane protein
VVLKRGLWTFGIQLLQLAASVGTTVLVTRVTGPHGRGVYTLIGTVAGLSAMISAVGISWAGIHFIGRRRFPLQRVASTMLTSALPLSALAVVGIAAAYALTRHSYFREVLPSQLLLGLALTVGMQLSGSASNILLGLNRPRLFSSLTLIQVGVNLVVQLGLAVTGSLTATTAIAAWVVGTAMSTGLALVFVSRETPLRLGIDTQVLRTFLGYGAQGYLANLLQFFNYRLDSLLVNGLAGIASLGYYSISVAIAETLWNLANAFSLVMFPHVSSLERAEADRLTTIVCRNAVAVTLVGAIVMFALGRPFILFVFGPALLPSVVPLWLLLPGIVTLTPAKVIGSYLSGIGKPYYSAYISGSTVVLTIALDLFLIPRYGIAGAAAASSVVYTCTSIASVTIFVRESGSRLMDALVVQPSDFVRYRRLMSTTLRRFASTGAP